MVDVGGEKTGNTGGEGGKNFQSSNLRSDNEEEETKWFNSSKKSFWFWLCKRDISCSIPSAADYQIDFLLLSFFFVCFSFLTLIKSNVFFFKAMENTL